MDSLWMGAQCSREVEMHWRSQSSLPCSGWLRRDVALQSIPALLYAWKLECLYFWTRQLELDTVEWAGCMLSSLQWQSTTFSLTESWSIHLIAWDPSAVEATESCCILWIRFRWLISVFGSLVSWSGILIQINHAHEQLSLHLLTAFQNGPERWQLRLNGGKLTECEWKWENAQQMMCCLLTIWNNHGANWCIEPPVCLLPGSTLSGHFLKPYGWEPGRLCSFSFLFYYFTLISLSHNQRIFCLQWLLVRSLPETGKAIQCGRRACLKQKIQVSGDLQGRESPFTIHSVISWPNSALQITISPSLCWNALLQLCVLSLVTGQLTVVEWLALSEVLLQSICVWISAFQVLRQLKLCLPAANQSFCRHLQVLLNGYMRI
jgi:hypothetical protein